MWSAGNEIASNLLKEAGSSSGIDGHLSLCDPTRPVTVGVTILQPMEALRVRIPGHARLVGYNYVDRWHERRELFFSIDRHDTGMENGWNWKCLKRRWGVYTASERYNKDKSKLQYPDDPCRTALEICFHECLCDRDLCDRDRLPGRSILANKKRIKWCYWPVRIPKDGYYFYQSQWTDRPMLHLFPHWNLNVKKGQIIPVLAYTNCDAVELLSTGNRTVKTPGIPRQGTSGVGIAMHHHR